MQITNVRIRLMRYDDNKVKAFASITIDDCFVVTGLKIIDSRNGLFVAMPTDEKRAADQEAHRPTKPGEKRKRFDLAFPTNNDTRLMIQDAVLDAYEEALDGDSQNVPQQNQKDPVKFGR